MHRLVMKWGTGAALSQRLSFLSLHLGKVPGNIFLSFCSNLTESNVMQLFQLFG